MPTIFVDDQPIEVKEGDNVLAAFLSAGLDLPYFCWHPAMGSIGSCRQCAVLQYQNEEDERGKIVMGCMTPVADGARFSLSADKASEFRGAIVESLMLNHPHDCPVCAEGGECHLQDMTVMVGHRDRRYKGRKNTHRNQYLGPLIHHEMNRCITCYRCVRYYRDYAGGTDLSAQASHDHTYFGRHVEGVLESEFSGNLVEVCPTGVFTDKTLLKHYSRKWDLQSAPSICNGCAVGCNISPGERYGTLKRVHNRYNNEVNSYFLCDRGRFGSGYVNSEKRLDYAGMSDAGINDATKKMESNEGYEASETSFTAIHQTQAIDKASQWISEAKKVVAIGSPRASLEANFLLREMVGADNFHSGLSDAERPVVAAISKILQTSSCINPSIKQMEAADAILILGEDITQTAPRIALGLRQAVRNKALQLADEARLFHWQDAAVRNLAQDQRSPMVIISASESRLDDVASNILTLGPDDIASFSEDIALALGGQTVADDRVNTIAEVLKAAKNPLIISGSSMLHTGIVSAASAVANALDNSQTMLSYCLPEVNSLGASLLAQESVGDLDSLAKSATSIDTLIILENDLSRRMPAADFKALMQGASNVIGMDFLENETLNNAQLVLPTVSYAEAQGTVISSEGRAQRYYPVFEPVRERLPSWQWLLTLSQILEITGLKEIEYFDQVVALCANSSELFAGLVDVAESNRASGLKIPRQTHRYSGRTAMRANVSVHEPQQPIDTQSPLSYTMEGASFNQDASLKPFFWSPGWNSNQSVQKFQHEVDGPLRGEPSGVRLFDRAANNTGGDAPLTETQKSEQSLEPNNWQLVAVHCLHGSEELSVLSEEVAELSGDAFIALDKATADQLEVLAGDGLIIANSTGELSLEVKIAARMAANCVGFSAGFKQALSLRQGDHVTLKKDHSWLRAVQIIASDRSAQNV
jgi:NADH-quinone oxidoreductase subunit G